MRYLVNRRTWMYSPNQGQDFRQTEDVVQPVCRLRIGSLIYRAIPMLRDTTASQQAFTGWFRVLALAKDKDSPGGGQKNDPTIGEGERRYSEGVAGTDEGGTYNLHRLIHCQG